jgi:hypothetical protein
MPEFTEEQPAGKVPASQTPGSIVSMYHAGTKLVLALVATITPIVSIKAPAITNSFFFIMEIFV